MTLYLKRLRAKGHATIGRLFLDGLEQCYTLEDVVRDGPKVPGDTAILAGRYRLEMRFSPHFQRPMPHLLDVPGFTDILIHPGNTPKDTEGCILVGQEWDGGESIQHSLIAFDILLPKLRAGVEAGESWITIENPTVLA